MGLGDDVSAKSDSLISGALSAVELHELVQVELGLLQQLGLSDINVLEGIHIATLSLDLLTNRLGDESLDEVSELDL